MKKLKSIILTLSTLSLVLFPAVALAPSAFAAAANIGGNVCSGTNFNISGTPDTTGCADTSGNLYDLLNKIVNIFSAIVGVIAVIMIVVGGLRYITSGGDANKVGAAKTTIIYALIGLVIVALSQIIVHFVLAQSASVAGGA